MSHHADEWTADYRSRRPDTPDTGLMSNGIAVLVGDGEFPDHEMAERLPPELRDRAARLRAELRRLRQGWTPSVAELAEVPVMTDAALVLGDGEDLPVLVGLINDDLVETDAVAAVDAEGGGWARTVSRWVRLQGACCLKEGASISPALLERLKD